MLGLEVYVKPYTEYNLSVFMNIENKFQPPSSLKGTFWGYERKNHDPRILKPLITKCQPFQLFADQIRLKTKKEVVKKWKSVKRRV